MSDRKRKHDSNLDSEQPEKKKICSFCSSSFTQKSNLDIHIQRNHTHDFRFTCPKCDLGFTRNDRLQTHILNNHQQFLCEHCAQLCIGKIALEKHMKQHKNIEKIKTRVEEDETTSKEDETTSKEDDSSQESAFNKTLLTKTWRIRGSKDPLTLMNSYKGNLKHYITSLLIQNPRKFYIVIEITMVKKNKDGVHERASSYFRSSTRTILRSTEINEMLDESSQQINTSFENFVQRGSGWILESIDYLKIYSAIFNPIRGKTYVPTPESIMKKEAVINIQNEDERCFEYAVVASQHFDEIDQRQATRPGQYSRWMEGEKRLNFEGCEQPMKLQDISKFEKNNNMAINVYHIKSNGSLITPLRITEKEVRLEEYINLLLIERHDRSHYTWIRNFDSLLRYDNKHTRQFCPFCCQGFDQRYEKKLSEHIPLCRKYGGQKVMIPPKGKNIVQFNDLHKW